MKLGHFSKPLHVINLLSKETLGGRCISDPGNTCPKIESKGIFEERKKKTLRVRKLLVGGQMKFLVPLFLLIGDIFGR